MDLEKKAEMMSERLEKIHAISTALCALIVGDDPVVYTLVDLIRNQSEIIFEEV